MVNKYLDDLGDDDVGDDDLGDDPPAVPVHFGGSSIPDEMLMRRLGGLAT